MIFQKKLASISYVQDILQYKSNTDQSVT